ncbi:MAG: trehalase family glycosidase [Phycisphaerae bacterium]
MPEIFEKEWLTQAPKLPGNLPEGWNLLWEEGWKLHVRSCQLPKGVFDDVWETVGPGYPFPAFGHWDIVHSVLDVLGYDPDFARRQLRQLIKLIRVSDGCLPSLARELPDEKGSLVVVVDYEGCAPPLWPVAAVAGFDRTGDVDFLRIMYEAAEKNLLWWEQNRKLPSGLYWFNDCILEGSESGYDICSRWDRFKVSPKRIACVDLCGQMGMYFDALSTMAEKLGEKDQTIQWKKISTELAEQVRRHLWHEKDGMFYDRDLETGEHVAVKSVACFWPMIAGQATGEQALRLMKHLSDPAEFFTSVPVPSVALNDPTFSLDCWRGPTWLSQPYWVMQGLCRYGYYDLADQIGRRSLDHAAKMLSEHGTIFEFYHPTGGPVSELRRKGETSGPNRDYLGHNPIHAIALTIASHLQNVTGET